ncbi:hypothetical protein FB451DRAFT_1275503 [Mycena latifolia]|nr:hypothetical protein FB451DRAFT_1275503 [Mycena latifolia]
MKDYGTIHYVSGLNEAYGRFYVLRKSTPAGEQVIVIQASAVVPESNMEAEDVTRLSPEWDRQFDYGLQLIQTLLSKIEFGRTNWGHLLEIPNRPRIVAKNHPLPIITEIPWCALIEERDIEITNWVLAEERQGVWNGQEVDLFMGWDASNVHFLQKMMAAYRLLIECDLEHFAYRALGHVVRNGTSDICGIMTEPGYGRMVQSTDKAAVYNAIAQVERAGLLFTGIHLSNIMLTNEGQVRLLSICALARQPADATECAKELAYWHWEQLETLFKELELGPNPIPPLRKMKPTLLVLPHFPAPEHGLSESLNIYLIIDHHDPDPKEVEEVTQAVQRPRPRAKGGSVKVLVFDAPVSARSLGASRTRLLARATVPYRKPDKLVQELLWAQNWPNRANKLTSGDWL